MRRSGTKHSRAVIGSDSERLQREFNPDAGTWHGHSALDLARKFFGRYIGAHVHAPLALVLISGSLSSEARRGMMRGTCRQ